MTRLRWPAADDTRRVVANPSKTGCQCVNHRGMPKQQHKTREAAEVAMLRLLGHSGRVEVYPCPTSSRWHVTTRRAA